MCLIINIGINGFCKHHTLKGRNFIKTLKRMFIQYKANVYGISNWIVVYSI